MLQSEMVKERRHSLVVLARVLGAAVLPQLVLSVALAQGPNDTRWRPAPPRVAALESQKAADQFVVPSAMPREVVRLGDAIFRIDVYEDDDCVGQGTGFVVKIIGRRVLIATCAHVLEEDRSPNFVIEQDEDGRRILAVEKPSLQQKVRSFKVVQRGDGRSYDVLKTHLHPQRQDCSGPDVAVVEIEIPATHPLPPRFELLSSEDQEPLHGQTVHLLGCPGMSLPDLEPDAPFYGRGMISQVDKLQRWIAYDMAAGAGASGSPVFILKPNRSGGQTAYVIAIHSCGQMFNRLSNGVHARRVAEVINQVPAEKASPRLPLREPPEVAVRSIGYGLACPHGHRPLRVTLEGRLPTHRSSRAYLGLYVNHDDSAHTPHRTAGGGEAKIGQWVAVGADGRFSTVVNVPAHAVNNAGNLEKLVLKVRAWDHPLELSPTPIPRPAPTKLAESVSYPLLSTTDELASMSRLNTRR